MKIKPLGQSASVQIELSAKNSISSHLAVPVLQRQLGEKPDIKAGNVEIRIGTRPTVRDLGSLYQATGRAIPAEMQDLFTGFKVLLLTHSVGVLREPGNKDIKSLEFEVSFPGPPRITIIDLFPSSKFVQNAGATLGTDFNVEAGVGLNGRLSTPPQITELLSQVDDMALDGKLNCKLQLTNKAGFVAKFSYSVLTPLIQAVGVGDMYSHWVMDKKIGPMVGDFIFSQTILAPKNSSGRKFKVRVSASLTTYSLLLDKWKSRWIEADYSLPKSQTG